MADPDTLDAPDAPTAEGEWIALLRGEVRKRTISAVAAEIGMARPSLSMLLAGRYPAGLTKVTARFEDVVLRRYRDQVKCPHLNEPIGRLACAHYAGAPMSASDPARLRHWAACQVCPINPTRGGTT